MLPHGVDIGGRVRECGRGGLFDLISDGGLQRGYVRRRDPGLRQLPHRPRDGLGPAVRLDGNDPAVIRATVADLAEAAHEGGGPAFVELITQRLAGHYVGDVQQYRSLGELEEDKRNEPIARAVRELTEAGVPAADISALEAAVRAEIEQAAAAALADPAANVDSVREHVYG